MQRIAAIVAVCSTLTGGLTGCGETAQIDSHKTQEKTVVTIWIKDRHSVVQEE